VWTLSGFADEISAEPAEQFRTLADLGIRYVELRSAWGTNVLDLDDEQLVRLGVLLRDHGLGVSAIGSPIGKIGVADDFGPHLLAFERCLSVAARFEAPLIRLFSFFVPQMDSADVHRAEVMRRMTALADRAVGHDVVLAHENEKGIYGDTPARCLDIITTVASPQLRVAWDAANFVQCGVRPFTDGYALLRPHLAYVQIKDAIAATGEVVKAGDGDGELAETVAALRDDGFDGFFSMEPHLIDAEAFGGFSGPELFVQATQSFLTLLGEAHVSYR
jgi:sugar phosphate isomerase/epimerase